MNTIKTYEISFVNNCKYQTQLVETLQTIEEVKEWYLNNNRASLIISIHEYEDIVRRGQSVLRI